jgi:Tol biopolymer transport system component
MSLAPGSRLGPYEIVAPLGAGGMGEVYRGRDAKLGRDVAIKILSTAVAADPDRIARFEREARVLAGLNHPHIAAVYGFQQSDGIDALVMELVEGATLSDRIAHSRLPLDETLAIARQIVDALEAAHEKGIVHRDLKPANIKVRDDGTVKVLDFGLAKALDVVEHEGSAARPSASLSPTLTAPTQLGMILGTAAYMAPEQARGKPVDKRADIWAFGAVLYEMLTGKRAFAADEISDTLAFVITKDPDWTALPPDTPPPIHTLLRRCLDKDRKRRLADIADARFELDDAADPSARLQPRDPSAIGGARGFGRAVPWALAGAATLAAVVAVTSWAPWRPPAAQAGLRLTADFGAPMSLATASGSSTLALSPVGAVLAFVGQPPGGEPQLYIRRLDQLNATTLERGDGVAAPFFSPDGQWLAYFSGGKLKKIPVNGGASIPLADAPNPRGGAWSQDGTIVFAPGSTVPLSRVSATGGAVEPVTKLAATEVTHRWPQIIDGGRAVLFTSSAANGQYEDANLVVQPLPNGTPKVVLTGGFYGRYVPSGHIVFGHAGTLFAAPFDLSRLEVNGPSVPVVQGVSTINGTGAAQFAVGPDGMLVYVAGEGEDINLPLMWLDSRGAATPLRTTRSNWGNIQFALDGRRLAMNITAPNRQIYVYDWARDVLSQLTFDSGSDPVWSPDGRDIAFGSRRESPRVLNLNVRRADGSGEPVRLTTSPRDQVPASWHPSGKFIAFTEVGTSPDVMLLPIDGDSSSGWKPGTPEPLLATQAPEWDPAFSPDGRWLAYSSGTSGRPEIYVQPFPSTGGSKWKVSGESGGRYPVWSRTSKTLMFMAGNGSQLMSASYSVDGNSFHAEKPTVWGEGRFARLNGQRGFDLHPDGTRVVVGGVREPNAPPREDRAVFILNFFDELRRLAPATGKR